jgi:hypothetical protein
MPETETQTAPENPAPEAPPVAGPDQVPDVDREPKRARSAADLKQRAVFKDITLPSGSIVDLSVPNLPMLIKKGKVPNELIDAALQHQNAEEITREIMEETWDFTKYIVPITLVDPVVTEEDVEEMSTLDVELIANIAARRTDTDAVGHQLGGLDTQQSFREFREFLSLRQALGSV